VRSENGRTIHLRATLICGTVNVTIAGGALTSTIIGVMVANKFGIYSWAAVLPASGTTG
jgi:hypothetical protein